jgi:hypothetical protein
VSGRHAEIRRASTGYLVRDLNSTNGTYVNGQRIEGEQALRPGDEVRFGAARFAMVAGSRAPSAIAKALGSVFGLVMIAGLGFLSFQFVHNWENLEKLGPTSAPQSAASSSIATNATSNDVVTAEGSMPMPPAAAGATTDSKTDEIENALRGAYARLTKGDSEGRDDYEAEIKRAEAAVTARTDALRQQHATAVANAEAVRKQAEVIASYESSTGAAAIPHAEMDRLGESAFPSGPGAPAPAGPDRWLSELNRSRAAVGQSPVIADAAASDGALKHSNYIATNFSTPGKVGAEMHTEDPAKPGYTTEGAEAATGEVAPAWYFEADPTRTFPKMEQVFFLNGWLEAPFHRPSLLRADIHTAGFGETCAGIACAAVLDLPEAGKRGSPVTYAQPILFPPPKYSIALDELPSEWPNPLNACPNYAFPVGVPITIQLGENVDAKLGAYAVTEDGKSIEACGFDASTYSSGNTVELDRARSTLKLDGEVVIVPRKPFTPGAGYDVSVTVNDHPYAWSFTTSH